MIDPLAAPALVRTPGQWNLSCPDWEDRIRQGRSLMPALPLDPEPAIRALQAFNKMRLPDVVGKPTMEESVGDWFKEIVQALFGSYDRTAKVRRIQEIFALVPKKSGKALALDTPIATPDGFTPMGQLRAGDLVIDADGRPTKVIAKSTIFVGRKCYEVEFSTGEKVVCDADHLWVTDAHRDRECKNPRGSRSTPQPSAKTTAEIARSLTVHSGKYRINNHRTSLCGPLNLPDANLPIPPYALGVWLGDGTSAGPMVTAGLDDADDLVVKLVANGQPAYVRQRFPEKGSVTIQLGIPNTQWAKLPYRFRTAAANLGLLGNKHIPARYLRASRSQRLDLLRGLIDTDGNITDRGECVFSNSNWRLCQDVRELVNSLGFKSSIVKHRSKLNGVDHGPCWRIVFCAFADVHVSTMPRKVINQKGRPNRAARSESRQIVAVREVASVPTQCIAVESATKQYLVTRSLIPTHNTTYSAALMLVALIMNQRSRVEFLFIGPTQAIAQTAYEQTLGIIESDVYLKKRFKPKEHKKEILDLTNGAKLKIKTFDMKILTGTKPAGILLDELWVMGREAKAESIIRQLRGGIISNPEAFLIFISTQSDFEPTGAFLSELTKARGIRDGKIEGTMLPIIYEFPKAIMDSEDWKDPKNWAMVNPSLGRSVPLERLMSDWRDANDKSEADKRLWASQHLNVEIGIRLGRDRWAGADHWTKNAAPLLTIEVMLEVCEVIAAGIDGGGLDDMLGLTLMGRHRVTGEWLSWSRAWVHRSVLDLRPQLAPKLQDLEKIGELVIIDDDSNQDIMELVDIVGCVNDAGLLAEKHAIGVDPVGLGAIVEELENRGIEIERIIQISQGWKMTSAIKTAERGLASGKIVHADQRLMDWCVGNAKIEPRGNAVLITKQQSGFAKIDPLMAFFNALAILSTNPEATGSSAAWAY